LGDEMVMPLKWHHLMLPGTLEEIRKFAANAHLPMDDPFNPRDGFDENDGMIRLSPTHLAFFQ
jgi:hypothetical protein